ncbi:sporulation protein YunB [Clostridium sp.]|uniref:sporulation protein YunB n=1 Tax=Clostridium sp. TaxID=1506 RepID=UPI00321733A1
MKLSIKIKFATIIFLLMGSTITFIYTLDRILLPTIKVTCDAHMRAEVTNIINKTIFEEYSKNFNYDSIIKVEKDNEGNITMIAADTLKLSEIAAKTALKAQEELKTIDEVALKIPIGYITKNNILSNIGPKIKIKMQPIGHITTRYISDFESAGINQTRHKIYIETTTNMRIIIPTYSSDLEIVNQIPIVETIIVGKVPNTAVQMDLNGN